MQALSPLNPQPDSEVQLSHVPLPFLVLMGLATAMFAYVAWPMATPLFFAAVFAVASRPAHRWLTRRFGGRSAASGGVMTLLLLAGIVVPLGLLALLSADQVVAGLRWLSQELGLRRGDNAGAGAGIQPALDHLAGRFHLRAEDLQGYLNSLVGSVQQGVSRVVGASLGAIGMLFVVLISFYFFTVSGHLIGDFLARMSPLRPQQTDELLREFRNVATGTLLGTLCTALGQGIILGGGFAVVGVPHALFFGIVAMFAALVPLVGSLLVWGPAVTLLVVEGRVAAAVGLAAWCFIMVTLVDNTVKPLVLRGKVEIHGGLLLLGFVGGIGVFGASGLVAGPLIVAFALTLYRIYQRDYLGRGIQVP